MSRSSPETETMREEMQECGTVEAFEEADFAILYREINESGTTTLQEITNVPQVFCQEIARQLRGHAQTPDLRELATKLLDFIDAEGPEAKAWQPISETAAALRSALSDTSTDRDDKRARQIEHGRKRPAQNNPDGYPPDSSPVETKGA